MFQATGILFVHLVKYKKNLKNSIYIQMENLENNVKVVCKKEKKNILKKKKINFFVIG